MFTHINWLLKSRYRLPSGVQKYTPRARATGIGSTVPCADHSKSVCFLASWTISSLVITAAAGPTFATRSPRASLHERPRSGLAGEGPAVDDHAAARDHGLSHARDLAAFVRVVVHVHVQGLVGQPLGLVGIEDHEIGVRSRRDRALARKEAEDLRGRGGGELDEPVERDPARPHAAVVDQAHPRFDAGCAVGDL